jgi:hypothetical protein
MYHRGAFPFALEAEPFALAFLTGAAFGVVFASFIIILE